jgi:hypothetical protein
MHPSKRIFPFRHLKDNVKQIIFNKEKSNKCVNEWLSSKKVKLFVPPSEVTKKLNDKRSLLPSDYGHNKVRAFSRTMTSSIFKSNHYEIDSNCSADFSNTIKYRNRPAKDNVTDLLRYTDGPKFRDEVNKHSCIETFTEGKCEIVMVLSIFFNFIYLEELSYFFI